MVNRMNEKDIRGKAYNKALDRLVANGHILLSWGYTEERKGIEYDITTNYVLDTYGCKYITKHFPEFVGGK
jgi:hypothetical protein